MRIFLAVLLAAGAMLPAADQPAAPRSAVERERDVPTGADRSEVPALEHDAVPLGAAPPPRRVHHVEPVWPRPATELWRFRLHVVVDASGRVGTARVVRTLVGDPAARPRGPEGLVPESLRDTPSARAGQAVLSAVRQWRYEPPRQAPLLLVVDVALDAADPAATATASPACAPLKVGGDIKPPVKLADVPPVYPLEALQARVTGTVQIEATIDTEGTVVDARVVSGVPLLDDAALAAVRQWRYTPTVVDGTAVPVVMTVTVRFSLSR